MRQSHEMIGRRWCWAGFAERSGGLGWTGWMLEVSPSPNSVLWVQDYNETMSYLLVEIQMYISVSPKYLTFVDCRASLSDSLNIKHVSCVSYCSFKLKHNCSYWRRWFEFTNYRSCCVQFMFSAAEAVMMLSRRSLLGASAQKSSKITGHWMLMLLTAASAVFG